MIHENLEPTALPASFVVNVIIPILIALTALAFVLIATKSPRAADLPKAERHEIERSREQHRELEEGGFYVG